MPEALPQPEIQAGIVPLVSVLTRTVRGGSWARPSQNILVILEDIIPAFKLLENLFQIGALLFVS
jgi:hypothetical protein